MCDRKLRTQLGEFGKHAARNRNRNRNMRRHTHTNTNTFASANWIFKQFSRDVNWHFYCHLSKLPSAFLVLNKSCHFIRAYLFCGIASHSMAYCCALTCSVFIVQGPMWIVLFHQTYHLCCFTEEKKKW